MRLLTLLFTLLFWFNAVAVAPYGIKGQSQSGTLYSNVHQFPNNQVTNMGGINALVETGNKNILVNPSFEHSTFSTGWTSGAGSFSQNLTVEIDGLKAAEVTLSAQALAVTQDSTLYASQFADGVQGLASVRVKTSLSGIKVCSRQAGVTSTTNCVNVQGNGKWGLYKVPMILGATSNGISIHSNGTSLTGTVYIDDAFVGATSLTQEINVVGNWVSFTPTGSFTTNTTYKGRYRQVGDSIEVFTELNFTGAPNAAQLSINLPGSFTIDTSKLTSPTTPELGFGDGTANDNTVNAFQLVPKWSTTTALLVRYMNNAPPISNAPVVTQAAPFAIGSGDSYYIHYSVPVTQFSNSTSVYSSTNADTDWASCGLTGAAFTGFGSSVPTPSLQCKRQGGDLLMKGTFTAGTTPTSVEARLALPTWNGVQLVSAGSSVIPSLQLSGDLVRNSSSTTYFRNSVLIEPSVSYMTFGAQFTTLNALTKQTGANIVASGELASLTARIPIEGWEQSNLIIGQFSGLESCTNTLECTDTFSAKVSSVGVVSGENVDWLSGNCSNPTTGTYNCTINTGIFSQIPNCTATAEGATAGSPNTAMLSITSATALSAFLRNTSNGTQSSIWNLICQKQGVDYIGKTAKAVASDQNVRSPGQTNVVHFAVSYGTTGTPCTASPCSFDSVGSQVSSVTRTALGTYSVNFVSPLSKVQCAYGTGYGSAGDSVVPYAITSCSSSCSAITFNTRQTNSIATLKDSFGNLLCTGIP